MKLAKLNKELCALALAVALAAGCATQPDAPKGATSAAPTDKPATAQKAAQNPTGPNVAPIGGVGAGGVTPVAGTEGVEGGGSGVGTALKAKAKAAAAGASQTNGQDDAGQ